MRSPLLRLAALVLAAALSPLSAQVEDLASTDPKVREKAVEELGDKGKNRQGDLTVICEALAKVVDDPVQEIREDAVIALIKTGDLACQPGLRAGTKDASPEVQSLAVDGLVDFYLPGYVKFGWLNSVKSFGKSLKNRFREPEPLVVPGYVNAHQHLTGDRLVQSVIPDDLPPIAREVSAQRGKA